MSVTVTRPGYQPPPPVAYLFIDAAYFRRSFQPTIEEWCGHAVDFYIPNCQAFFGASKVFYYDSIDDTRHSSESDVQAQARIAEQEKQLREINAFPNVHVDMAPLRGAIGASGAKKRLTS
jgi:hypothetical protein